MRARACGISSTPAAHALSRMAGSTVPLLLVCTHHVTSMRLDGCAFWQPAGRRSDGPAHRERAHAGAPDAEAGRMLREWAPAALRALHERDLRRRFCPPALWLAPFEAAHAASAGAGGAAADAKERFSAAAVVRALWQPGGDDGGVSAGGLGGGGRPAALAALLAEAPQCVPFALRVEVFRALVAAERARCGAPARAAARLVLNASYRRMQVHGGWRVPCCPCGRRQRASRRASRARQEGRRPGRAPRRLADGLESAPPARAGAAGAPRRPTAARRRCRSRCGAPRCWRTRTRRCAA
jgi:hypothetical protein